MDKYVRTSIDGRKQAIFATYEVGDEGKKKIDKLFVEIEKLGEKCSDVGEFEAEFLKSSLNQEYMDLFTEIAMSGKAKATVVKEAKTKLGKEVAKGTAGGVVESIADQAKNAIFPTRASINQSACDAARRVPVLGDAMDIGQKAGYVAHLGKLFGSKKKKSDKK